MPRYKLTIEYDGTPFVGWQIQGSGVSVQGRIREAVKSFTREDFIPRGAGRTDAGVHALGQVAHIDLQKDWEPDRIREALNHHLKPEPIAVILCEPVTDQFDARFSALKRHYVYRILNRRARPALDKNRVWHVPQILDAKAMHVAAQKFVGLHDFTTFRSVHCQAQSPVKTIDHFDVIRAGDDIHIEVSARSFMHNQVRSMVGSLKCVGEGKWSAEDLDAALKACNRAACGPVAPACGLYFAWVEY